MDSELSPVSTKSLQMKIGRNEGNQTFTPLSLKFFLGKLPLSPVHTYVHICTTNYKYVLRIVKENERTILSLIVFSSRFITVNCIGMAGCGLHFENSG